MAILKKIVAAFKRLFAAPKRRSKSKKIPRKKVIRKKTPVRSPQKSSTKKAPRKVKASTGKSVKKTTNPKTVKKGKTIFPKTVSKGEIYVGDLTHFFSKIQVGVLKVAGPGLKVGDLILVKGQGHQFTQKVKSLQIESVDVQTAQKNSLVGLKLEKPAKVGDQVFRFQ